MGNLIFISVKNSVMVIKLNKASTTFAGFYFKQPGHYSFLKLISFLNFSFFSLIFVTVPPSDGRF